MLSALASYAMEQFLLSVLLLLVCAVALRWLPANARHPWLAGALVVAVLGPLLPFVGAASEGAGTQALAAIAPSGGGGGIGIGANWTAALLGLWGAIGLFQLHRLFAAWRSANLLAMLSPRSLEMELRHSDLLPPGTRVHLSAGFGPAVLGVWKPCIVLPARLAAQLTREALRAVIAHEAEHIARRDPVWHALQRVILAVFWWNPALARLARWLDQARELACDAGAAARAGDRLQYAEALLCVAGRQQPGLAPRSLAGLAMTSKAPLLEHRIDALLDSGSRRRGARSAMNGVLVMAMASAWATASTATPAVSVKTWEREPEPARAGLAAAGAEWERLSRSARAEHQQLSQSAQGEYERLSQAAQSEYERLSQTAQSRYERLARAAQSEHERLSQTAQSRYEQLARAAQSEHERLSRSAQIDYEQRLAAADRGLRHVKDLTR